MSIESPTLVVGGSGQIGHDLLALLSESCVPAVGTYFQNPWPGLVQLDASDSEQVSRLIGQVQPRLIINASNALGGTDACELNPGLAEKYHFGNGRNLADAVRRVGAKFVQISTDYVFDGESGPYTETDLPNPLSKLGRAKLKLEEYVLRVLPDSLVVRTTFVFSWTPQSRTQNFVMQILENQRHRREMKVPVDQVGNVTYSPNFCAALVEMVRMDLTGLYHLAGTTRCSKYDWALRVAEFFKLDPALIEGVTTSELGQAAQRPLNAGLVLDKVKQALKKTELMVLEEGLRDMKRRMSVGAARS